MTPETVRRLRAIEMQIASLMEQVGALVSEAEASEAAGPALVTEEQKPLQFYGQAPPEAKTDAPARPSRTPRR